MWKKKVLALSCFMSVFDDVAVVQTDTFVFTLGAVREVLWGSSMAGHRDRCTVQTLSLSLFLRPLKNGLLVFVCLVVICSSSGGWL